MFERIRLKKLNDHLYLMDDAGESTGYLVIGREKALMIDTMNGFEDAHAVARSLTDKPITVINTHGHCDHICGNIWFEEAYICEKDIDLAREHSAKPNFVAERAKNGRQMPPFRTIRDGDVIDLGSMTLDVIELAGHTKGGICLLLREDRILFTGDAINRNLWMQLEESLPIKEAMQSMDRIAFVKDRADKILHGHATDFDDISLFDKLREGMRQLAEEECHDPETEWFGGIALRHEFDKDSAIIYTPAKLPKLPQNPQRGHSKVAFCGKHCAEHCPKGEQCGGCDTPCSCCSFAATQPDGICPNVRCAKEKGHEGCWQCEEFLQCDKGIYSGSDDAVNLAKGGAHFIQRHGKTDFAAILYCILKQEKVRFDEYIIDKSSPERVLEALEKLYEKNNH